MKEATGRYRALTDAEVIAFALTRCAIPRGTAMASPTVAREWLMLHFAGHKAESFGVLFLDSQNCLIEFRTMFTGTLNATAVYPREILRAALETGACAVILTHNHPSGNPEPSPADRHLTDQLKAALRMVDCAVLDHVVIAGDKYVSLAERGQV